MATGDERAYASTVGGEGVEPEAEIGRELAGRYVLRRLLGRGGFGAVYESEDLRLEKRVAVKLLSGELQKRPDALGRFKQEAIAAARIGHHGIVDVTDFDQDTDGTHFIVMELIDGVDLALTLQAGPLPLARALTIAARVAQTLAQAHSRGIVHRDLKPANIMLTSIGGVEDVVKVLDFGISKIVSVEQDVSVTATGNFVGTPKYMAPEQGLGGRPIDGRADVYALGGILYEMVTGQAAYDGSSHYEVIHNKLSFAARPPSIVVPEQELPSAFDHLVLKALEKDLDQRYASMVELDIEIRELLAVLDPSAAALVRPATPVPRPAPAPLAEAAKTPAKRDPAAQTPIRRPESTPQAPVSAVTTVASPRRSARTSAPPAAVTPAPSAEKVIVQPQKRSRRPLLIGAVVLAAAGAVAVYATTRPSTSTSTTTSTSTRTSTIPTPTPTPNPTTTPSPTPSPEAAPTVELVEIQLVVDPPGARIELDGEDVTAPIQLAKDGTQHALVVSSPGRQPHRTTISAATKSLTIKLEPVARKKRTVRDARLPDAPL